MRNLDRAELATDVRPWVEWLKAYFDCSNAGLFLLQGNTVAPLFVDGAQLTGRPEPELLHAMLAAGVETGTSLVVGDMAAHSSFRRALGTRADIAIRSGPLTAGKARDKPVPEGWVELEVHVYDAY